MTISVTPAMEANRRINEMRNEQKIESNKLNKAFNKIVDSRDQVHEEKVKSMAKTQEKELSKADYNYQNQLEKNKNQFTEEVDKERTNMKERLEEVREKHNDDLLALRRDKSNQENKLKETYENVIQSKDKYLGQKDDQYKIQQQNINKKLDEKLRKSTQDIVDYSQQNIKKTQQKNDEYIKNLQSNHQHEVEKQSIESKLHNQSIQNKQAYKDELKNNKFQESLHQTTEKLIEKNKEVKHSSRRELQLALQNANFEQNKLKMDFKNKLSDIQNEYKKILQQKDAELHEMGAFTQDALDKSEIRHQDEINQLKEHYEDKVKEITVAHGMDKQQIIRKLKEQHGI